MTITTGQKAPDFALFDTDKQKRVLHEQQGSNIVLLFFPLAFTSVCTAELCSVRDNISLYNQADARVFGISVDSLYTLGRFKAEQQLNFPLLSDFNKEASRAFGVLYDTFPSFEMQGVSKRAAFVIDKQGIVRYAEICPTPKEQPDFAAIQRVLAGLRTNG
ncbi:redoxin domain-containing protein [Sediminibacterium soli]|uniref:redoxin domain-containing protein n=1 Tax=Sediminibacterium soli TaxID=2698829 RepID=UPI00137AEFBC|nr:redoxin domain-containing protein [Sediminibacterium soli]NCI45716.1 redoxin domain-containing protein [Sediminibacterium soli]